MQRLPRTRDGKKLETIPAWDLREGSSGSQMTAAKIMDVIASLPGCDGQAAHAVSPYTQVKLEDALDCINS